MRHSPFLSIFPTAQAAGGEFGIGVGRHMATGTSELCSIEVGFEASS